MYSSAASLQELFSSESELQSAFQPWNKQAQLLLVLEFILVTIQGCI